MQLIDTVPLVTPANLVSLRNRICFIASQLGLSDTASCRLASIASELGDLQLQQEGRSEVAIGIRPNASYPQLCLRFSPWSKTSQPTFLDTLPCTSHVRDGILECCQKLPAIIREHDTLCQYIAEEMQRHVLPSRAELEMLATHDGLTQLLNRSTFNEQLAIEIRRAKRYRYPLSLMMMDIDHFKHINDTYGHQAGDACLITLSETVQRMCREQEIVARYGGEEFVIIVPHTEQSHALLLAERLRQGVENTPVIYQQDTIRCTISIGLAQMQQDDSDDGSTLISRADQALYQAKKNGRNQVCMANGR